MAFMIKYILHRSRVAAKVVAVGFALLLCSNVLKSQTTYWHKAEDAFAEGSYKAALDYYVKALKRSGNNIELMYKAGESARLSNDYKNAIKYYSLLLSKQEGVSAYTDAVYHLAAMYRYDNNHDSAVVYYQNYLDQKKYKVLHYEDRARQELASSRWALSADNDSTAAIKYVVANFGKQVNTKMNESGAVKVDSVILFSRTSHVAESESKNAMFSEFILTQIYQTRYLKNGKLAKAELNEWGMNNTSMHSGNVAYDAATKTIYFSLCDADYDGNGNMCGIYKTKYDSGSKRWLAAEKLPADVNLAGYTSTQPAIGHTEGKTLLYYVSDRPGGCGGLDIWYVVVEGDKLGKSVNLGSPINSPGDEVTPYYCDQTTTMFFSSDWHNGYGGYDIFESVGGRDQWRQPRNMGRPINTSANDLYFTMAYPDTAMGFLTSNREGSFFTPGNTCCNDIYQWKQKQDSVCPCEKEGIKIIPIHVSLRQQAKMMVPISLYFHNDEPNPKSNLPTTSLTYTDTYNSYIDKKDRYIKVHTDANDTAELKRVHNFFADSVEMNYSKLGSFVDIVSTDLRNGRKVKLLIKGYASPLHTDEYNYILSRRRIATFINQLQQTDSIFVTMGNGANGNLEIEELPFGSSKAAVTVSRSSREIRHSVYGVDAALERKIEILDYNYFDTAATSLTTVADSLRYFVGDIAKDTIEEFALGFVFDDNVVRELDFVATTADNVSAMPVEQQVEGYNFVVHIAVDTRRQAAQNKVAVPLEFRIKGDRHNMKCTLLYNVVE